MIGFTLVEFFTTSEEDTLLFSSVGGTVIYTGLGSAWPKQN